MMRGTVRREAKQMTDMKKREIALRDFKASLDKAVIKDGKMVSALRMNLWTLFWLFGENINNYGLKQRGESDWPYGAFAHLGEPYESYMFVDNTLADGVYEIDMEKD